MIRKGISRRDFIKGTANISLTGIFLSSENTPNMKFLSKILNVEKQYGTLDKNIFSDPGTKYRGVTLWLFNDRLNVSEALRQLQGIRYAGWGRVILRNYRGLIDATYGVKWNEITQEVLKECGNLQMKVFLQEADKNAAGYSVPTKIPGMKDAYRHKLLVRRRINETPDKNESLISRIGDYSYYRRVMFPRPGWEDSFCYLDLLDPNVVSAYLEALFGFFKEKFGFELGRNVEAIWVDEPHSRLVGDAPPDSLPWTPNLPETFQKEWGYSLLENLPLLFIDIGDFQKVRHHYWRTVCNIFTQSYTKLMGEWCERFNLKFSGHLMGEDTFSRQIHYTINCMPHYEYMQLIGIDFLTGDLRWPSGYPNIMTAKQASSVANQLGEKEVLCEMYGVGDQGTSFEDRKFIAQWFGVLGINYRCYHATLYSMRGLRKRFYPPNLNFQQPWWDENRIIADFSARLSYVLRQGEFNADILIIHPIESYYLEAKLGNKLPMDVGAFDKDFITLSNNLLKIQKSYDYGDESLLEKYGKVVKNILTIGEMSYKVVILPSIKTLRKSTVELLNQFIDEGGKVISIGMLPTMIDGIADKKINSLNEKVIKISNDQNVLKSTLDNIISSMIQLNSLNDLSTETIWIHHRSLDNGKLFFLTNISKENTIEAEIKIKGNGKLENWNLETGKIENIPQQKKGEYIITKLKFEPTVSYLLVLNEKVSSENILERVSKIEWQTPLKNFRVIRHDLNSLTLDFCQYRKGNEEWSEVLPIIGVQEILSREKYNGPVTLQFKFTSETKPNRCAVVIEDAKEYSIMVNGYRVAYEGLPYYRDLSFHPIDISHLVQPQTNYIQLTRNFEAPDTTFADKEDLTKFWGTELEQIYLIGDFAVRGERIGQDIFEVMRYRYKPKFIMTYETGITNGDLLADGYCFFNGTITLVTTAFISGVKEDERYYIDVAQLDAVFAKVGINNRDVGKLAWKPYRLEITDFIWPGENKIEISLTNSLRNLLGEFHFVPLKDEYGQYPLKPSPIMYDGPDWLEKRKNGTVKTWSDDYFFRPFGIGGSVSLICEKYVEI